MVVARWGRWAAGLAGLLLPLAFAPFNWYPLAFVLLAILMFLCEGCHPREAAWRGFWFGFAAFAAGAYWIYISIHLFGGAPVIIAGILMLGLYCVMAVYLALMAAAATAVSLMPALRWCLVWPALFTGFEWLRSFLFSGFPWLTLGYGQIDGPLAVWAPIAGVHGISFVTVMLAGGLLTLMRGGLQARVAAAGLITAIVVATVMAEQSRWIKPVGDALQVSLVQGSITQDQKWRPEQLRPTLELYKRLTFAQDADLVIWPEVAVPALASQVQDFLASVAVQARAKGQQIYLGILTLDRDRNQYRNSIIGLGQHTDQYHKRHLVPFGEFFPVPDFARRWMRSMDLPNQDTLAGSDEQSPLPLGNLRLAPTICYEDAYGAEQLGFLPAANILINVSNDAWFGDSIAAHQHLQIARMRALETGRFMLRTTNTGITAIISPSGTIVARAPQFEPYVLSGAIQPYAGSTPYVRFGNWPVL
ncbi:MAG: apolipoprotein N-acyltransferase, partial [Gammaproteobacteria bacterium]|nr:apolipoprotein N-acyltransferase [Gammaproteobacteria bacterium]